MTNPPKSTCDPYWAERAEQLKRAVFLLRQGRHAEAQVIIDYYQREDANH